MKPLPRRLGYGEEATLVEHLGELRGRLIVSLLSLIVFFCLTYAYHKTLLHWLNGPLPDRLHNKPATFGHPFYSLAADYRMTFLMMAGRMDEEVAKYAVKL